VGFYFSHLDWSHPDYAPIPPNHRTGATMKDIYNSWPDGPQNPHWQRFLAFHRSQLHELCANYGPLDLLWFDGDWQPGPEYWQMGDLRNQLQAWQPNVILNGRLAGHGDYVTPEQGLPIVPPAGPWEFCVTLNDSWGYQPQDHNYKSLRQIVRLFAECIGMGGNLLLDVGPKPDGTIPPEQIALLESLGAWIHQHEEAIYPTTAGLPAGLFYGASTLSQDRKTLYLFTFDRPWEEIAVKGIRNPVKRASILGSGRALKTYKRGGAPWVNVPGVLWLELPEAELDPNATVVKLEFDEPLDLYTGSGISIQAN
ncbi:MAG TPA: alpha-L-fucosidase, partial [Phototrophicaceae bacterium]|nr:alpha-L-fucosidase [Phototrophicaceae bacterium]